MSNELRDKGIKDENIRFFIGDVRDESRLNLAFKDVDFVIHAAALKQILQQSTILRNVSKLILMGQTMLYLRLFNRVLKK